MSLYSAYLQEIEDRKGEGLHAKPIDDAALLSEVIDRIKDPSHPDREASLHFFVYNVLPGTTSAGGVKAQFLKSIVLGDAAVAEITRAAAFEQLSHMKGGPSVEVLLDLALGEDADIAAEAGDVLKTQVFLYEADTERLETAHKAGNALATSIIESYAQAEFFTKLPDVEETIDVVTYIAGVGDISTDLLSPGSDAHSRSDRELHGKSMFEHDRARQQELLELQKQHPGKRVMLVAEKGTMGVGSSRMSGVNNVALWIGKQASPFVPFINIAPVVAGTNGISPIFLTTVGVTGGIGVDLKNWVKKTDADGNVVMDAEGEPVLEQTYAVETGTVLTINTKTKKLYKEGEELIDISSSLTPQKMEFMRAGGSYAIVFGKKLQTFAAKVLGIDVPSVFATSKEISHEGQGFTAVEKIFNKNAVGTSGQPLHAGSYVRAEVNIVGSQDTTGLMTSQELEMMAATTISPIVDGAYQSGCHTASVWDLKAQENIPRLMRFMNDFGLITGRDPEGRVPRHDRRHPQGLERLDGGRLGHHHRRRLSHAHVEGRGVWRRLRHGGAGVGHRRGVHADSRIGQGDVQRRDEGPHGLPRRRARHPSPNAPALRRGERVPRPRDRGPHRHLAVRPGVHLHRLDRRNEGQGVDLHLRA